MRRLAMCASVLLLAACGGSSTSPSGASAPAAAKASAAAASAAPGAPERDQVTSAYGTTTGSSAPLWLGVEKGFFGKHGLNVKLEYAQSSATNAALLANEAQFGISDAPATFTADAAGASLRIIAAMNKSNPYAIVVRPEIKTAADLKGKSLALAKPGDTSDISARMALTPLGLQIGTDVTALSVGNSGPRLAALLSGQVAGAILSEAFVEQAVSQGMHVLVSLEQAKIPYIANGVIVTQSFAKANPNAVLAYLKGLIEAVRFYADESKKAESMAVLATYFKTNVNDPAVDSNYRFYHARLAHDLFPDKEGLTRRSTPSSQSTQRVTRTPTATASLIRHS
jgi:NitT/TauT family transport system substrate-binding protein